MEEQAADLARPFKVGGEAQELVAECLAELLAFLGERRDKVGIEGVFGADRAEYLAGAADLLRFDIFEDEDVEVVARRVVEPFEAGLASRQLLFQRRFLGWQIGEASAGQLGEIVE